MMLLGRGRTVFLFVLKLYADIVNNRHHCFAPYLYCALLFILVLATCYVTLYNLEYHAAKPMNT